MECIPQRLLFREHFTTRHKSSGKFRSVGNRARFVLLCALLGNYGLGKSAFPRGKRIALIVGWPIVDLIENDVCFDLASALNTGGEARSDA